MYSAVRYFLFFVILELFGSAVFFVFRDIGTIRQLWLWYLTPPSTNISVVALGHVLEAVSVPI
jgi:hypothetical protein